MRRPKPIIHSRDHEHGGADPVRIQWDDVGDSGGGGSGGGALFVITGDGFSVPSSPLILDTPGGGSMRFSTTSPATFDASGGRARILGPGTYVVGCQMNVATTTTLANDTYVYLHLGYDPTVGYGIEIPWLESGFLTDHGGEEILGSRYMYPTGASSAWDICLQRLHPISLTSATTFPVEILPTILVYDDDVVQVPWLSVWGWRLGDPLDVYHSD